MNIEKEKIMNNKVFTYFLAPLIVAIAAVVVAYLLNIDKPDVRYTLSEEIPLLFTTDSDASSENVQQLEVRNIGSTGANEIVVKISEVISDYKVIKYVSSDTVKTFVDQQPVEFVYSNLPPQAGFKIIFTSPNVVAPPDISVSHSTGQAVDALSVSNRSNNFIIYGIYVLLFGGYILWFAFSMRNLSFDLWRSETKRKRIDQALKTSKPWYVGYSKWAKSHIEIIKELLREEYVPQEKVASCAAYQFFEQEKPGHFSDSDWIDLSDLAINKLKDHLSKSIESYSESSILSVIRLIKPERFPKDDWNTIQTNANENFIERNKARIYRKANMVELLHKEKPEAIPDDTWQTLQNLCRERYFNELVYEINIGEKPRRVIGENDLSILGRDQQTRLENMVQQLSKYEDYQAVLEGLLEGSQIPDEQPITLSNWEWQRIKDLEELIDLTKEIDAQKQELTRKEYELMGERSGMINEQTTFFQLKDKVLRQLEYINNLINDPSIIERIESYDDTFSSGNWKNLIEIATLLKSRKGD